MSRAAAHIVLLGKPSKFFGALSQNFGRFLQALYKLQSALCARRAVPKDKIHSSFFLRAIRGIFLRVFRAKAFVSFLPPSPLTPFAAFPPTGLQFSRKLQLQRGIAPSSPEEFLFLQEISSEKIKMHSGHGAGAAKFHALRAFYSAG